MPHPSLTIIRSEHRALSALLRTVTLLLSQHRRIGTLPDFRVLRAMLFYVDEFPEKLHHPKETQLLFPKLRGRDAHTDAVLDQLDRDHMRGEQAIRELEHMLLGFEMMSESNQRDARNASFEVAMNRYVEAYLEHMHIEETEVLPLAEAVLSPDEWRELDAGFVLNSDPATGHEASLAYRDLFKTISQLLSPTASVRSVLQALGGSTPPRGVEELRNEALP